MSATEVAWRVGSVGAQDCCRGLPPTRYRRRGCWAPANKPTGQPCSTTFASARLPCCRTRARQAIAVSHRDLVKDLVAAAERIADGGFRFFGYPEALVGSRVDWHYDPLNDVPVATGGLEPDRPSELSRGCEVDLGAQQAAAPALAGRGLAVHGSGAIRRSSPGPPRLVDRPEPCRVRHGMARRIRGRHPVSVGRDGPGGLAQ